MKTINKFISLALLAMVLMVATISPAMGKEAPRTKQPPAKTGIQTDHQIEFGIGDIFKIFSPLLKLLGMQKGYRNVEKNVFVNMPEKMPKEYRSPRGVKVHAESPPTGEEFAVIDAAFDRIIRNTSGDFAEYNGFTPVEAFRGWKLYRKPSDFRVWLIDYAGSIVPSEADETLGCPVIRTTASATGKAAEAFGGLKLMWGGEVKEIYPFIVAPRIKSGDLVRAECKKIRDNGIYFGMEHAATLNRVKVNGKYYQSFMAFTGALDLHNIFKDR